MNKDNVRKEIRCDCPKHQLLGIIKDKDGEKEFSIRWVKYEMNINKLSNNEIEIVCPHCRKVHTINL